MSRGLLRMTARTQRGGALLWSLLFVLSIGMQYAGAFAPSGALAANASGNVNLGGFEIDGDFPAGTMTPPGDDWSNHANTGPGLVSGPAAIDPVKGSEVNGVAVPDTTVFSTGSKEGDPPTSWSANGTAGAPSKGDIGNVFATARPFLVNGQVHFFVYLGIERLGNDGTVYYDFEFNQHPDVSSSDGSIVDGVPSRTAGDLLFVASQQGSGQTAGLAPGGSLFVWTLSGTCVTPDGSTASAPCWNEVSLPAGTFAAAVNQNTITPGPWRDDVAAAQGGTIAPGEFYEAAIDLTGAGINLTCPGSLGTLNVRSRSSISNTAQLKDFVAPITQVLSNCGALTWQKQDDKGQPLGGATFTVSPNPLTGSGTLTVADNTGQAGYTGADSDARAGFFRLDNVIPGTYTITETVAPAGHSLDPNAAQSGIVVSAFQTTNVSYIWKNPTLTNVTVVKKDATTGANIDGASFQLWNDVNASHTLDAGDTKIGAAVQTTGGTYTWTGLGYGNYLIQEVSPPAGYSLPATTVQSFSISAQNSGTTRTFTFNDPEIPSSIKVVKLDAVTNAPLAGAVFGLRSTPTGADITTCTTATDGSCTFSGLLFGTYYVVEEKPPTGYQLSNPSTQGPITIDASNAGTTQTLTFSNPHTLSSLTVKKVDAESNAPLAGATFELHSGSATGTLVGTCSTTLPSGTCSIGSLDFGSYYWVETAVPTGYNLPAVTVQGPITINAGNAGTTFAVTTFSDPRKLTDITVVKEDAVDQSKLDGAVFALRNTAGGSNLATCATLAGSCTFANLDFGTYYVVEITPPVGYSLPAVTVQGPYTITTANAGQPITVTFLDPRLPGTIQAEKVDAQGGAGLPGAIFDLHSGSPTGSVVGTQTSDASGNVTFTDVAFGTYYVVERTPPLGYSLPAVTSCGPITISATNLSDFATCTGANAFTDAQKPASLSLDKQVQPSGGSSWSAVGLKGSSTAIDLAVNYGSQVVYRYVITNTGQQPIEGLTVTDNRVSSGSITCLATSLAPGASTTCTSTPQTVTSQVENTASVGGTFLTASGTHDVSSNQDSVIVAPTIVSIVKTNDTTGPVAPGTAVHYTLTLSVTNGPVASAKIVDKLPTGIGGVTAISNSGAYDATANTITWNLTNVTDGLKLTYTATVSASAAAGSYTNTATITSGPCVAGDCTSTSTVPVANLVFSKTVAVVNPVLPPLGGIPQAQVGEVIHYTLTYTVTNGPLTNAVVTDALPLNLTSASNPPVNISNGGTYDGASNTITWNLGTLATGSGTLTYDVTATAAAAAAANQPFLNTATIDTAEVGPISATAKVLVAPVPQAATFTPPPTSTFESGSSNTGGGLNLAIVLLVLAGLVTTGGLLAPAPSPVRRRSRRG